MSETMFVRNLKVFNRKERFYLIGAALGNPNFKLCEDFIGKLQGLIKSDEIDFLNCRFVAMDYHLDWIYASLFLAAQGISPENAASEKKNWKRDENNLLISATQQDIDLIAVFADTKNQLRDHLFLVEAKGVGSWNTRQLQAKGKRIEAIFSNHYLLDAAAVVPHFVYAGPKPPNKAIFCDLPSIMNTSESLPFVHLKLPDTLAKLTQCSAIDGKASGGGPNWKVEVISDP
jgi:hypothetical protein